MYIITEWIERYEVNEKGDQARLGHKLRVRPLEFIRSKVHGRSRGAGFAAMQHHAGDRAYEVFGLFHKFLEIAGCEPRDKRGQLLNARGNPAKIDELAFVLGTTIESVEYAMQVLINPQVGWIQEVPDDEFRKFPENPENEKQQQKIDQDSGNSGNSGKNPESYVTEPNRTETERNETERNETPQENPEEQQNSQAIHKSVGDFGDFQSNSFSLRFDSALGQILNTRSKSDRSAIRNLVNWLNLQVVAKRFDDSIFKRVAGIAKESKNGRNPRAVFFSRLDEEIGYRARVVKEKQK